MRTWTVWPLLALSACGGIDGGGGGDGGALPEPRDSGQQQPALGAPPPASQLPDGGMTADGGSASDADRLRTQLQWFAAAVDECQVTKDTVLHEYETAQVAVVGGLERFTLSFRLGGGATTDTYFFPIDLVDRAELEIKASGAGTNYTYQSPYVWFESLSLTIAPRGISQLSTWTTNGHVAILCMTR